MADIHNDVYSNKKSLKILSFIIHILNRNFKWQFDKPLPSGMCTICNQRIVSSNELPFDNIFVVAVTVILMALDIQAHEDYIGCRFRWMVKLLRDIG